MHSGPAQLSFISSDTDTFEVQTYITLNNPIFNKRRAVHGHVIHSKRKTRQVGLDWYHCERHNQLHK